MKDKKFKIGDIVIHATANKKSLRVLSQPSPMIVIGIGEMEYGHGKENIYLVSKDHGQSASARSFVVESEIKLADEF